MELYYKKQKLCVVIFVSFYVVIILPTLMVANIGDPHDEYWKEKAAKAWNNTLDAYEPHPEKVTTQVNKDTAETLNTILGDEDNDSPNNTRRQLKGKVYGGPCTATNPIDRCWRCQPNWANNRKRLADCALGFGRGTIGGKNGELYIVTDSSDNSLLNPSPGTLRHAVIQQKPLWIIFSKSMSIRLAQELIMQGDKTIDGRGVHVDITNGAGITVQYIQNVIIHGIHIHNIYSGNGGMIRDSVDHYGFRTRSDGDGISIFGSSHIWIDHVSISHCTDGIIDAVEASTAITISNSHFTDHNDVMLFGASDSYTKDSSMQITLAYNHFGKRLVQRMPRCRLGYIHVVNNDYTHWEMYAIGGSKNPTIISQGNRFIAPPNPNAKEVTKRDYAPESVWKNWDWISDNDYFLNGAFFVPSGDPNYIKKHANLLDNMVASSGKQVDIITKFSGALNCKIGSPC